MLQVQEYLRSGKSPEDLEAELAIGSVAHPSLPLLAFSYHQIDSPKYHPMVRECRGLVLERDTWNVVAKPFDRFFNVGEDPENFKAFDWATSVAHEKVDGSLMIVYHYLGEWHCNTRRRFGFDVLPSGKTWREAFWGVAGDIRSHMAPFLTYLFEMWTPHNCVIRVYDRPRIWLLGVVDNPWSMEASHDFVAHEAEKIGVETPESYGFKSMADVEEFLREKSLHDKTFEGVVIRDAYGRRFKAKSPTYLALHRLKGEGGPITAGKLVPLVLAGEVDEVASYIPGFKEPLRIVQEAVNASYAGLVEVWRRTRDIESQKDFAQAVIPSTPFSSILFRIRRDHGHEQTEGHLRELWRDSESLITKVVGPICGEM